MGDNDKPFACSEPGCGMRFANEDHLSVHKMKHQMSLTLTPGAKTGSLLSFVDQTPTPTKFLRNCEEIGLFNELSNNPFEEAFKKASKNPENLTLASGGSHAQESLNTPTPLALQHLASMGPATADTLHTPNLLRHLASVSSGAADTLHTPNLLRSGLPEKLPKKFPSPLADNQAPLPGPNSETASTIGSTPGEESNQSLPDAEKSSSQGFALSSPSGGSQKEVLTTAVPASIARPIILGSKLKRQRSNSSKSVDSPGISEKKRRILQMDPPTTEVSSSDEMTILEEEEVVSEVVPSPAGSVSSQIMSPVMMGSPGSVPTISTAATPVVPTIGLAKNQSQYMLQVMVQMPGGQMMPVHIPAAIANTVAATATTPTATVTKATEVQPRSLPVTLAPAWAPGASSVSSTSVSASASIKQRLKETIRQNAQHNILNDNMRMISEAAEIASSDIISYIPTTNSSSLLPVKLSSIKSEVLHSVIRGGQVVAPPAPQSVVQLQAADTSTPSTSGRSTGKGHQSQEQDDTEDRRMKFLERNRAAAARCRTKKKIWTGNLEKKAEEFQKANAALQSEVSALRGEVAQLKTLLLAHKDCPVTAQQQRSGQLAIQPDEVIHTDSSNNIIIATETAPNVVTVVPSSQFTNRIQNTSVGPVILNVRSLKPLIKHEKR